jgi:uncharacterized OB-fold protein
VVHPDAEYAAFLAEGRFMLQRSRGSGAHVFFPRVAEPGTGAADLEWVPASGAGTLYSFTIVRNKQPADDYVIALVDLAEGVRMMSRVIDVPHADLRIGMRLAAFVGAVDGTPAVLFRAGPGTAA